jgi:plastocyanin
VEDLIFTPLEKWLLSCKSNGIKHSSAKFCIVSREVHFVGTVKGAEMIRMSRFSWRGNNWIPCLATLGMTVVISFQSVRPGVLAAPAVAAAKVEIKIDNFRFRPAVLSVKVGTQITWTNEDDIPHIVVSKSQAFKSKVLATGEKFTFTAGKAGTYAYFCSIHPNMTGKVIAE